MKKLSSPSNVETLAVRITGKVQGVGYRITTVRQAHSLGVTGWVRNLEDGSVEGLLQGPHDRIDQMLSWLHIGPPAARVEDRKSTRLNSSHVRNSYAVFCLKKKNNT